MFDAPVAYGGINLRKSPAERGLWLEKNESVRQGAVYDWRKNESARRAFSVRRGADLGWRKNESARRARIWVGEKFRKGWIFVAVCGMMVAESEKEVP